MAKSSFKAAWTLIMLLLIASCLVDWRVPGTEAFKICQSVEDCKGTKCARGGTVICSKKGKCTCSHRAVKSRRNVLDVNSSCPYPNCKTKKDCEDQNICPPKCLNGCEDGDCLCTC